MPTVLPGYNPMQLAELKTIIEERGRHTMKNNFLSIIIQNVLKNDGQWMDFHRCKHIIDRFENECNCKLVKEDYHQIKSGKFEKNYGDGIRSFVELFNVEGIDLRSLHNNGTNSNDWIKFKFINDEFEKKYLANWLLPMIKNGAILLPYTELYDEQKLVQGRTYIAEILVPDLIQKIKQKETIEKIINNHKQTEIVNKLIQKFQKQNQDEYWQEDYEQDLQAEYELIVKSSQNATDFMIQILSAKSCYLLEKHFDLQRKSRFVSHWGNEKILLNYNKKLPNEVVTLIAQYWSFK